MKANNEVRAAAKKANIPLYVLAHNLGISEATMVRKLRFELPAVEKSKLLAEIAQIAAHKGKEGAANADSNQ